MDGIFGISFRILGIMFVLFTIGRSLNVFCLYREDRGIDSTLDGVLTIISALLMLAGFPVFGVYYLFAQFDTERTKRKVRNERQENYYKNISEERQEAYSNGYEDGFSDGEQQFFDFKEIENIVLNDFTENDISETKEYMAYHLNRCFFDLVDFQQKNNGIPDDLDSTHLLWRTFMSIASAPIKHYGLLDSLLSNFIGNLHKRCPHSIEESRISRMKCYADFVRISDAFEKECSYQPHMIAFAPETAEKYAELVLLHGFNRKDVVLTKSLANSYRQIMQITDLLVCAEIISKTKNSPEE